MSGATDRVLAVITKDLRAFSRDTFYVVVTVLGLVFYVIVLYLLPTSVDESVSLGIAGRDIPAPAAAVLALGAGEQGLDVRVVDSREALREAVLGEAEGEPVAAGVVFPDGFLADVAAGERVAVEVLVTADVPGEVETAVTSMVREIAHLIAGQPLPVTMLDTDQVVIGVDRVGAQTSLRDQMLPMFAFAVLLTESFALASLVAGELHTRTATALLVTPLSVPELLTAKAVVGTLLAFVQTGVLLAVTGGFEPAPGPLLLTLLLGSLLVTGVGLIAGSLGKDFLGIVSWSMLFMVPLAVPAFTVLFPGSAAAWVQALPTHGFVAAMIELTRGLSLGDVAGDLLALAAWCAVGIAAGMLALRMRVARL